jgi:multiple sugar transport system permease protein
MSSSQSISVAPRQIMGGARRRRLIMRYGGRFSTHLLLVVLGISWLMPFLWMVSSSLKVPSQMFHLPPIWIPNPVNWENYVGAVTQIPFFLYMRNTIIITVLCCVGSLVSCPVVAYSFSRLEWPGRDVLFIISLATMMIPFQVTMIPLFIIFTKVNWVNTWLPLIIPAFFGNAFYIFLLRQFFLTIPAELSDACRIDGADEITIFIRIMLPLTRPALATILIFETLSRWTDFIGPLIYLSREELYTISIGLQQFVAKYTTAWARWMAASTLVTLPVVVLFIFAQRYFIEGIALTGLKG